MRKIYRTNLNENKFQNEDRSNHFHCNINDIRQNNLIIKKNFIAVLETFYTIL